MYSFTDTIEASQGATLPSEALKINGEYIENQITGYRTLYVSGRESLAPELTMIESGSRDGSVLNYKRYPVRTITVWYQLLTASAENFRKAYNVLMDILSVEDSELIFADEPDKYFTGTFTSMSDIDPGRNCVTGEIEFTCLDPFKYSVEEYEVEPASDGDYFAVQYNGNYKSYPTFEVDFYNDESGEENNNGRCGYVAFFDDEEHVLQFGNPDELSEEQVEIVESETNTYSVPTTKVLLNHSFKKSNSWNGVKSKYIVNKGTVYKSSVQTGTIGAVHSYNTTAEDTYYLAATGFGTGNRFHGPTVTYTLSEAATDFELSYAQKMCIDSSKDGKKQCGAFQMILSDASGNIIAGVDIYKASDGTKGRYRMIVDGKVQKEAEIDLSLNNKFFGQNRVADKKKKITEIKTVKSSSITKKGAVMSFNLGGIKQSFTFNSIKTKAVKKITIMVSKKANKPALKYNGLYYAKIVKNYSKQVTETIDKIVTEYHDVQNKFNANDVFVVDSSAASAKLNELDRPDLGALGNDWEDLYLQKGMNQIGFSYSDWVESDYAPKFKLRYREVFL